LGYGAVLPGIATSASGGSIASNDKQDLSKFHQNAELINKMKQFVNDKNISKFISQKLKE